MCAVDADSWTVGVLPTSLIAARGFNPASRRHLPWHA